MRARVPIDGVVILVATLSVACDRGFESAAPLAAPTAVTSSLSEPYLRVSTGSADLQLVNRLPAVSYSTCMTLVNPNAVPLAYTAEMEVYTADGSRYDTFRYGPRKGTLGPLGGGTTGCGGPTVYDFSFSRPVATRYVVRVMYAAHQDAGAEYPRAYIALKSEAAIDSHLAALPPRLIVSEFRTRGPNGPADQFIELYNDSLTPANLRGVGIFGGNRTSNSTDGVQFSGGTIAPGCHYLVTGPGYSGRVPGDASMPAFLRDDGNIRLRSGIGQYDVGDLIGMDGSSHYSEGTPLAPFGESNTDRSYRRVGPDTDNNARDFRMTTPSSPENSSSCGRM